MDEPLPRRVRIGMSRDRAAFVWARETGGTYWQAYRDRHAKYARTFDVLPEGAFVEPIRAACGTVHEGVIVPIIQDAATRSGLLDHDAIPAARVNPDRGLPDELIISNYWLYNVGHPTYWGWRRKDWTPNRTLARLA